MRQNRIKQSYLNWKNKSQGQKQKKHDQTKQGKIREGTENSHDDEIKSSQWMNEKEKQD